MNIKIYSTEYCPYCTRAKMLLKSLDLDFTEIDLGGDEELRNKMIEQTGQMTVPIIFIDDKFIGGFDQLAALHAKGELVK